MLLGRNASARDAHAQLVMQLCEALSTFVAATTGEVGPLQGPASDLAANDDSWPELTTPRYDDVISLRGILVEFGLNQPQVMKLRKRYGFPAPIGRARPLMFRRDEVERWVRSQPNPNNLAIILRGRS
jgi:predicted small lipoprotein YifL